MEMMIDELFALQVERTPDRIAVSFDGERLTYRELALAVDQVAAALHGKRVGPGALVALFFDRSLELVVAMLGVLKAGGAYVPLDPTHPSARLAYILEDAKPRVLLSRAVPPVAAARIFRRGDRDRRARTARSARGRRSTGAAGSQRRRRRLRDLHLGFDRRPKGVAVDIVPLVNLLQSMSTRPGLGADDVLVAITTLTFDISGLEIFLPLICGAHVVVASDPVARDGVALAALIDSVGATVLQATPSGLRMLIDSGWRGAAGLKVLCGGEAWSEQLAAELLERSDRYGICTDRPRRRSGLHRQDRSREAGYASDVRSPIPRSTCSTSGRQLVPVGVTGELYIGGAGLARGYLSRDDLTRERFVRDPFSPTPGATMYRTGDLVRRRPDGTLEFFGRTDHQVKIRGHRVELGEIETELARQPGVQQALVAARDDTPGGPGLVAYVILAPEGAPSIDDLRRALQEALPAYMVPAVSVILSSFPLTPNGKVDRKALPHRPTRKSKLGVSSRRPRMPNSSWFASFASG